MIRPETQEEGRYVSIATKVSTAAYATFNKFCKRQGVAAYEMLQNIVAVINRWASGWHTNRDIAKLMHIFDDEVKPGIKKHYSLTDPDVESMVGSAIYYLADREGKKTGVEPVLAELPFMGEPNLTQNLQTITEYYFSHSLPDLYRRLRMAAVDLDTNSVTDTIGELCSYFEDMESNRTIAETFSDLRSDYNGKPIDTSVHYKRTRNVRALQQ